MNGGKPRTYPAFPDIEEQIGYNPARFLDHPQRDPHHIGDATPLATARAMIRGMDDLATIQAWMDVETALGRGTNGEPRSVVSEYLEHREGKIKREIEQAARADVLTAPEPASDETDATDDVKSDATDPATTSQPAASATSPASPASNANAPLAADGGTTIPTCPTCQSELAQGTLAGDMHLWCATCCRFFAPDEPALMEAQA